MESRIPVPTDNIFKLYALFGLLLFIFCCSAVLYVVRSANEVVYASLPELEGLKQIKQPTSVDQARIALLQRKLEITKADKDFFIYALGGIMGVALLLMFFGFRRWHQDVQPIADETAKVQLEIAKLQLERLRQGLKLEPPAAHQSANTETPIV